MHFHRKGILIFSLFLLLYSICPSSSSKANDISNTSHFDWRDQGYGFSVKDQGDCKAGYAFAGVEAVQAAIWKKEGVKVDLSVNNAIRCNWHAINDYDIHSCKGGDFQMIVNLFTQEGLVSDSCDPFNAMNLTCNENCESVYYVTEWQQISRFQEVASVTEIKELLAKYGPIYSEMEVNTPGFEDFEGNGVIYYEDPDVTDNTHAVIIVGWDDELPHSHGKGAWIVKNSFGTDWGEDGYFNVAYGSAGIGNDVAVVTGYAKSSPLNKVYFYDEAAHNNPIILDGNDYYSDSALAIFSIDSEEFTRSVEFWTNDQATVNMRVYSHFENKVLYEKIYEHSNFQVPFAGYYNFSLPAIEMKPGEEIVVELEVTNEDKFFPIMTDNLGPPSENRTWYKDKDGVWQSLYSYNRDAGIRLRTSLITEDFSRVFLPMIWR